MEQTEDIKKEFFKKISKIVVDNEFSEVDGKTQIHEFGYRQLIRKLKSYQSVTMHMDFGAIWDFFESKLTAHTAQIQKETVEGFCDYLKADNPFMVGSVSKGLAMMKNKYLKQLESKQGKK